MQGVRYASAQAGHTTLNNTLITVHITDRKIQ